MNDIAPPIPFTWNGEAFSPRPTWAAECDKHFVIGQVYRLVELQERSMRSHGGYFATVYEAFQNLPEHLADQIRSVEHLRKLALIKVGYYDVTSFVASSENEANKIAATLRRLDSFAIVTINKRVINMYVAKSQSLRAMDKDTFEDSKRKVLDVLASMIGTTTEALHKAGEGS